MHLNLFKYTEVFFSRNGSRIQWISPMIQRLCTKMNHSHPCRVKSPFWAWHMTFFNQKKTCMCALPLILVVVSPCSKNCLAYWLGEYYNVYWSGKPSSNKQYPMRHSFPFGSHLKKISKSGLSSMGVAPELSQKNVLIKAFLR